MSYDTSIEGEVFIDPPLVGREITEFEDLASRTQWNELGVKLVVEETPVETDEGTLIKRTADRFVPIYEDPFRAYYFERDVALVVRHFWPKHRFTGEFEGHGEEHDDLWQLHVFTVTINGAPFQKVTKVKAVITWPAREQGEEVEVK